MKFKTLYLAAVMLLAALQVVHADTYSNVYTLADVTQGNEGEVVDPSLNKEWEPGIDWHTMQIGSGGLYISNNKDATYITLASNRTQFADADLWYRTGNNTDGYLIYNKEAGPNKVLAAPTTMKGTQGGDSYPIMVDKDHVPEGYTSTWLFAKSNDLGSNVEAFYMYEKGHKSYKVNNRNGKFAFWTGGADLGSSIQWKWAQRTMEVNMNTGTFTSKNSNWAKTWTSTASAPKLVVDAGANNMSIANSNATRIQAFRGTTEPQSYTISAGADYAIAAYSFDFVMSGTTAITLTDAAGHKYTSKSTAQTVDCKDLNERSTSFQLSGANAGVDLTHFLVTIRKAAVPAEPQVEIFTTPTTQAIPYRIPAIATAYDGTVVAVADYRYSRVDIGSGRIDLHIRRSHDNGATWDDIMMPEVMRGDGDKTEGHQKAGYGDPCIVGDSESPRMIITACSGTPASSVAHAPITRVGLDGTATTMAPHGANRNISTRSSSIPSSTRAPMVPSADGLWAAEKFARARPPKWAPTTVSTAWEAVAAKVATKLPTGYSTPTTSVRRGCSWADATRAPCQVATSRRPRNCPMAASCSQADAQADATSTSLPSPTQGADRAHGDKWRSREAATRA